MKPILGSLRLMPGGRANEVMLENSDGARSRTRTGTALLPRDFKSLVSPISPPGYSLCRTKGAWK